MTHAATGSLYDVLGVSTDASERDIKVAFRRAAREAHPDRGGDPALFGMLTSAYETLSKPERRAAYDASLKYGEASVHDPAMDDEPWGVEDTVEPPPGFAPPGFTPPADDAASRPGRLWSPWRIIVLSVLTLAIVVVGYGAVMGAGASGSATVLVAMVMTAAVPLRVCSRRGIFALLVEAAVIAVSVAVALNKLPWPHHPVVPLVTALLMAASGEVARPAVRGAMVRSAARTADAAQAALVHQWDAMVAASRTQGRLYWLANTVPYTSRTEALVFDPSTGEHETVMLWGLWQPHLWVVVDRAGVVVASCLDPSREAWSRARAR